MRKSISRPLLRAGARGWFYAGHTGCQQCPTGTISYSGGACQPCPQGQYTEDNTKCLDCGAGSFNPKSAGTCSSCALGTFSTAGSTGCSACEPGLIAASTGSSACTECPAGKHSNTASDACDPCAAGTVSEAGQASCQTCGAGTWSEADQPYPCTKCGDDVAIYKTTLWDPSQSGLTSSADCKCARGRTGASCEFEDCASTTPAVSLGFLLLEVQWPQHARTLSENEAFSGISAAFRAFDANGDDLLNVTEAQTGIAAGGMAVPEGVTHIWYREAAGGVLVEMPAGTVTITQMIQDQLDQLEEQKTVSYYDHPSGSGAIPEMNATYPNSGADWDSQKCRDRNTLAPKLAWTVERNAKIIYQQCAFFNGVALDGSDGLNKDVSSGKSNVDGTDCSGTDAAAPECSFEFNLPSGYQVKSYYPANSVEVLTISVHSYCVETKFCNSIPCTNATMLSNLTVTRCTTGLQQCVNQIVATRPHPTHWLIYAQASSTTGRRLTSFRA